MVSPSALPARLLAPSTRRSTCALPSLRVWVKVSLPLLCTPTRTAPPCPPPSTPNRTPPRTHLRLAQLVLRVEHPHDVAHHAAAAPAPPMPVAPVLRAAVSHGLAVV